MKVALTGGATGIGAEVAKKLLAAGSTVTVFDIAEPLNATNWIKTDMSDADAIAGAISKSESQFDALINNAGLPPKDGMAERVLQVNWFGLTQFLEGMLNKLSEGAAIVNTASRAGQFWNDNLEEVKALMGLSPADLAAFVQSRNIDATRAYNLSKEALIVMTIAKTEEMIKRGLRVNSVSPAAVSTGILDDFVAAFGDRVSQNIAKVGRAGLPEEIADVIIFLASPQSHWIKGQDIVVDGGMSAIASSNRLGL